MSWVRIPSLAPFFQSVGVVIDCPPFGFAPLEVADCLHPPPAARPVWPLGDRPRGRPYLQCLSLPRSARCDAWPRQKPAKSENRTGPQNRDFKSQGARLDGARVMQKD